MSSRFWENIVEWPHMVNGSQIIYQIEKRPLLTLSLIYVLSYWLIAFNFWGIYFDDWVIFGVERQSILKAFEQAGYFWSGYIHLATTYALGPWGTHILNFSYYWVAAICIYKVLLRISKLKKYEVVMLTAMIISLPVNHDRLLAINSISGLTYMSFALGTMFFVSHYQSNGLLNRLLSLFFLGFSILIPTFIPFYGVILIICLFLDRRNLFKKVDFFLMPVFLLTWRKLFTSVSGAFKSVSYNTLRITDPVELSKQTILVLGEFLWQALGPLVLTLMVVSSIYALASHFYFNRSSDFRSFGRALLWGLVFLILAVTPYVAAGKPPLDIDWSARHQLLTPLGTGLTLFSFLRLVHWRGLFLLNCAVVVAVFVMRNNNTQIQYYRDWIKQESIMGQVKSFGLPKGTYAFEVVGMDLWVNNRSLRFYEYSGMLRLISGTQDKLGYELGTLPKNGLARYESRGFFSDGYNLADYRPGKDFKKIRVKELKVPSFSETLMLWFLGATNKGQYRLNITQVVSVELQP
jgi:hypothetical protein